MNVYCQMVMTTITSALCEAEQGCHECRGCGAVTRRCVSCGRTGDIVESAEGFCAECAERHVVPHKSSALLADDEKDLRPYVRIEHLLERVRAIGIPVQAAADDIPAEEMGPSALVPMKPWKKAVDNAALLATIEKAVGELDVRSATVLQLHYGLQDDPPRTLEQIAEKHGFSRQRAHQIKNDALQKLETCLGIDRKAVAYILDSSAKAWQKLKKEKIPSTKKVRPAKTETIIHALLPSPLLARPDVLLDLLAEHATKSVDGRYRLKEPARILMVRAKLLPDEIASVLQSLVSEGKIESAPPWSAAALNFEPAKGAETSSEDDDEDRPTLPKVRTNGSQAGRKRAVEKVEYPPQPHEEVVEDIRSPETVRRAGEDAWIDLLIAVSNRYRIDYSDLLGESREERYAIPRQVGMYLLREDLELSYPVIGQLIGRDHTTVIHAHGKIAAMILTQVEIRRDIECIRQRLGRAPSSVLARMPDALETAAALLTTRSIMVGKQRVVRGAIPIIQIGLRIGPVEAQTLLQQMKTAGTLSPVNGWGTVVLHLSEVTQSVTVVPEPEPAPIVIEETFPKTSVVQVVQTVVQEEAPASPTMIVSGAKTYTEVYTKLLARSALLNGERIVRGAVPLLQTEFKVGAQDAVRALEHMEAQKYVASCNGWGTIKLVSESVQDDETAFMPLAPASRRPTTRPAHLRVVTDAMAEEPIRQQASPLTELPVRRPSIDSLDAAIARLEDLLPKLRGTRDEIVGHIATLEISLATLRACKQQAIQAEELVERSIQESEKAATELLSLLHSGEKRR